MSKNGKKNKARRKFLGVTLASGGIAAVGSAYPFVSSLQPNKKTRALGAPVRYELDKLTEGQLGVAIWRRKPVWILRRTSEMISQLSAEQQDGELSDPNSQESLQPDYCKNSSRSIKKDYFVAVGLCTHLGCSPGRSQDGNSFICACHGSKFDTAGRVFAGSPAPSNLIIPAHRYLEDGVSIEIGVDDSIDTDNVG